MSYLDRLRTGRYVSPSGKEFVFQFDDLQRAGGKKSAVHELPQQDVADVQDMGATATTFDLRCYLSGADYDQAADAFFAALGERNPGTLMHPRWGDLRVLAVTFTQSEQFVDGLGQAVFEIAFVRAPLLQVPESATQTASAIAGAASDAAASASAVFAEDFGEPDLADLATCKEQAAEQATSFRAIMAKIVGDVGEAADAFNAALTALETNTDLISSDPLAFATAWAEIAQIPARLDVSIVRKADAYAEALEALSHESPATVAQGVLSVTFGLVVAIASALGASVGSLLSRSEALAAHDRIEGIGVGAGVLIEAVEEATGYVADPLSVQLLAALTAQASSYLLEASFSLRAERRVLLDGAATPLELVYRFYQDLARLDEFCDQNHLQGDAILIVPAGTEVRYYAE